MFIFSILLSPLRNLCEVNRKSLDDHEHGDYLSKTCTSISNLNFNILLISDTVSTKAVLSSKTDGIVC